MDVTSAMSVETESDGITRGNRELAEFVRSFIDDVIRASRAHARDRGTSPTTATGIWAMDDTPRRPDGSPLQTMHGNSHDHETSTSVDRGVAHRNHPAEPLARRRADDRRRSAGSTGID